MRKPHFSIVRLRRPGDAWLEARMMQLNRTGEESLHIAVADGGPLPFEKGEEIEVHLPIGACFRAKIISRGRDEFSLDILEQLKPEECEQEEEEKPASGSVP